MKIGVNNYASRVSCGKRIEIDKTLSRINMGENTITKLNSKLAQDTLEGVVDDLPSGEVISESASKMVEMFQKMVKINAAKKVDLSFNN